MDSTVQLRGVVRTFGTLVAVDEVDLTLSRGRIYGLLGPNGCGKTTTLKLAMGLMIPDRGEVSLFGGPPDDQARARVGYVPEVRALPLTARPEELLVFYCRMRGMRRPDARAAARRWIERLDLADKSKAAIQDLSNGQQQKVQIALALVANPDLIFLDEPLTGLDPTHQDLVSDALRACARDGATIVLSTHRLREAQEFIQDVVLMAEGRVVLANPLEQALRDAFDGVWAIRTAGGDPSWMDGPDVISRQEQPDGSWRVKLVDDAQPGPLLRRAAQADARLLGLNSILPDLHDLYRLTVGRSVPELPEDDGTSS